MLDKKDKNYPLILSKHNKRRITAQQILSNDSTVQETIYNCLFDFPTIEINHSELYLKNYITEIIDKISFITEEENSAIIPIDETL